MSAPNEVWCRDITYVRTEGRWHYVTVVIDLFTHRVVGWALSSRPDTYLVIKPLDMAYEQHSRPRMYCFTETKEANTVAEAFANDCSVIASHKA